MNIHNIARIERKIVSAIIQNALDLNYTIIHHNGEEITTIAQPNEKRAKDFRKIMNEIRQCDEEYLIFKNSDGKRVGSVFLVYGNDGYDVINDHTANEEIDKILATAFKIAEKFE